MHLRLTHVRQKDTTSCGVACLQMLTGLSFDEVCSRIDWRRFDRYYTDWPELKMVLGSVGMTVGRARPVTKWDSIKTLAIVQTGRFGNRITHFMVYDGLEKVFYDPWRDEARKSSRRTPFSYLPVSLPPAA